MTPTNAGRVTDVGQTRLLVMLAEEITNTRREAVERARFVRRQENRFQPIGSRLVRQRLLTGSRRFFKDDVRVRAAEAKRADAGKRGLFALGPVFQGRLN